MNSKHTVDLIYLRSKSPMLINKQRNKRWTKFIFAFWSDFSLFDPGTIDVPISLFVNTTFHFATPFSIVQFINVEIVSVKKCVCECSLSKWRRQRLPSQMSIFNEMLIYFFCNIQLEKQTFFNAHRNKFCQLYTLVGDACKK